MKFRPEEPMHERYAVAHGFLSEETGREAITISQTVNAFFRWEFNSCEMLVKDGVVYPIDYANACPDVAVTSLHYYFPWAMKALLRWTAYCVVTGRSPRTQVDTGPWFAVADDDVLDYQGKLAGLPGAGRRLLRDRALPVVLRDLAAARRRDGARVDRRARLRVAAALDDPADLPAARVGALRGPLRRAARHVGVGRATPPGGRTTRPPEQAQDSRASTSGEAAR